MTKKAEAGTGSWTKIGKVHRIIEFNQEAWLKLYINMNMELTAKAKNGFESQFFKLMNS